MRRATFQWQRCLQRWHLLLGEKLDTDVKCYIQVVREGGGVVTSTITMTAGTAIVKNHDRTLLKVTMNKLCARLFIIIFMTYTRKSECIPTVTNFASILANYFYFLWKITAQWPSVLNFRGRLGKFLPKKFWTNRQKMAFSVVVYEECYSKFYVAPTFQALLENCHRLDLDTCARRLVTENGEFEGHQ